MPKFIKAKIVENPPEKTLIVLLTKASPIVIGENGLNETFYKCGNCDNVIAEDINPEEYQGKLIRCPTCQCYNNIYRKF